MDNVVWVSKYLLCYAIKIFRGCLFLQYNITESDYCTQLMNQSLVLLIVFGALRSATWPLKFFIYAIVEAGLSLQNEVILCVHTTSLHFCTKRELSWIPDRLLFHSPTCHNICQQTIQIFHHCLSLCGSARAIQRKFKILFLSFVP